MINIVTKYDGECYRHIDDVFNLDVIAGDFTDVDLRVMKEIDGVELLDRCTGAIRTHFGLTDIEHLSSGCKTVLYYLYLKRMHVDNIHLCVTRCGWNALEVLFTVVDELCDNNTIFVLEHVDGVCNLSKREYNINGVASDVIF